MVITMSINVVIVFRKFMLRYTIIVWYVKSVKVIKLLFAPTKILKFLRKHVFFPLLVSSCFVFVVLVAGCCGVAYSEIALTFLLTFNTKPLAKGNLFYY